MTLGEFRKATEGMDDNLPLVCKYEGVEIWCGYVGEESAKVAFESIYATDEYINGHWEHVSVTAVIISTITAEEEKLINRTWDEIVNKK